MRDDWVLLHRLAVLRGGMAQLLLHNIRILHLQTTTTALLELTEMALCRKRARLQWQTRPWRRQQRRG